MCDNLGTAGVETVSAASLTVGEQQNWKCTFTNTAANGSITIVKHLANAPAGTFTFSSSIPGHAAFSLSPSGGVDASVSYPVAPLSQGSYAVSESNPSPFTPGSATCSDQSPVNAIVISPGEHVTCTFTNNAPGTDHRGDQVAVGRRDGGARRQRDVHRHGQEHVGSAAHAHLVERPRAGHDVQRVHPSRHVRCSVGRTSSWSAPRLSCTFSAPVSGDAGTNVTDTVTAHANDGYGRTAVGSASAVVAITDVPPAITMTKVANPTSVPEPGASVTYTASVTNASDEPVTLTSLTDKIGGGLPFSITLLAAPLTATTCVLASIPAHGTYSCTFNLPVLGNAVNAAGTLVSDIAAAHAVDNDGSGADAQGAASVRITDVAPSLAITKTSSTATVDEPGANVTYTVSIHNTSVEPVVIDSITDQVGGGPIFNVTAVTGNTCGPRINSTVAAGATVTCAFTLAVTGDAGDIVNDTVVVRAHDDEGNQASGSDTETVTVKDVKPSLQVTKDANLASVPEPGGTVGYTVTVRNTSVEPVVITAVTDKVGGGAPFDAAAAPGSTCGSIVGDTFAPDASASCTFSLAVTGEADSSVVDTATVTADDNDGNNVDGADTATVRVTDVLPTIAITKTAGAGSVPEPGADVSFSVSVQNTSPEPVTLTALTDSVNGAAAFPLTGVAGTTCALPQTIGAGGSYGCVFTQHVTGDGNASVSDTVKATAHDNDGNTVNGQDSEIVGVTDVMPVISVTKVAASTSVAEPGADVTYTVTVHNSSVEGVTLTVMTDTVGGGSAFPVTGVTGTTCTLPRSIAAGGDYTCAFTQHVSGDAGDVVNDTVARGCARQRGQRGDRRRDRVGRRHGRVARHHRHEGRIVDHRGRARCRRHLHRHGPQRIGRGHDPGDVDRCRRWRQRLPDHRSHGHHVLAAADHRGGRRLQLCVHRSTCPVTPATSSTTR